MTNEKAKLCPKAQGYIWRIVITASKNFFEKRSLMSNRYLYYK